MGARTFCDMSAWWPTSTGVFAYVMNAIEAPDLDRAVRIAAELPEASAPSSGVEVRPVVAP